MENEDKVKSLEIQLLKANQEINNLKSSYENFIHLAAHDLQSPVRKINTFLERFIEKCKKDIPEEAMSYITRINNSLDQLTSMIKDIANLAEIKIDRQQHEPVNLTDLFNSIISSMISKTECNTINFSIPALPVISGNLEELKYLFSELLNNSIKFKKTDCPLEITVNYSRLNNEEKMIYGLHAENIYANIMIHDNGIGFNKMLADRIVKPFERLHGNSTYPGNGIGLAICKKITESHLGIFQITGKENEGATSSVILPENQN